MHRIDSRYAVPEPPEPGEAVAAPGYFQNGDEESETPGTKLDAAWCNAVQEELAGVVEKAGLTLDKAKRDQLAQAIMLLVSASPEIQSAITASQVAIDGAGEAREIIVQHVGREGNPHGTTAGQVGAYTAAQVDALFSHLDGSQITGGVIDVDRLPKVAISELVTVADDAARFALTIEEVQLGDHVKVEATDKLYFVKDDANLDSEAGYELYAASIGWSSVTGKPSAYPPSAHTHPAGQFTGILPVSQGGTGAATAAEARAALGISGTTDWGSISGKPTAFPPETHTHLANQIAGILSITQGGTGAATAAEARAALGVIDAGGFNARTVVTTSTSTWKAPVTGWYKVTIIGGGGGGGKGGGNNIGGTGGAQGGTTTFNGQSAVGGSGGGGGGSFAGAGGGECGQVVTVYMYLIAGQTYAATIGAGGVGATAATASGQEGADGSGPYGGGGGQIGNAGSGGPGASNGSSYNTSSKGGPGGAGARNDHGFGNGGGGGGGYSAGKGGQAGPGATAGGASAGNGGTGGPGVVIFEYYDAAA